MYRMKYAPWVASACVMASMLACNKAPQSPTAPPAAVSGESDAAADGSTLKVSAPTLVSPINDTRLTNRRPSMVINNATGKFAERTYTYEFQLMSDSGAVIRTVTLPAGAAQTTWNFPDDLDRDTPYRFRARARLGDAFGPWSGTGRFLTLKENRTPDPSPNSICFDADGNTIRGCIPPPNKSDIVSQVVAQNPGIMDTRRSCQEEIFGGDHIRGWEFLDKLVDALFKTDSRFGYNCKRGNCSDISLDVVTYHYGIGPTTVGNSQVYAWDVVLGHCGGAATPAWIHITNVFGSGGAWSNRGRTLEQ